MFIFSLLYLFLYEMDTHKLVSYLFYKKFCIIRTFTIKTHRPVAQFWLERCIDIAEVDGSSPFGSTKIIDDR